MSRTPPIVLRISSGTQNFTSSGISSYYYYDQLKSNLALRESVDLLGQQLFFPSTSQTKRSQATLKPEILPLYTILRAKQSFSKLLLISKQYFNSRALGCAKQLLGFDYPTSSCRSSTLYVSKNIGLQAAKLIPSFEQPHHVTCLYSLITALQDRQKVSKINRPKSLSVGQLSQQNSRQKNKFELSILGHYRLLKTWEKTSFLLPPIFSNDFLRRKQKESVDFSRKLIDKPKYLRQNFQDQLEAQFRFVGIDNSTLDHMSVRHHLKQAWATPKAALFYLVSLKLLDGLAGGRTSPMVFEIAKNKRKAFCESKNPAFVDKNNLDISQKNQGCDVVLPQSLIFSTDSRITQIQKTLLAKEKHMIKKSDQVGSQWSNFNKVDFETHSKQSLAQKAAKGQFKLDSLFSSAVIKPILKLFLSTSFKQPTQLHLFLSLGGQLPCKNFQKIKSRRTARSDLLSVQPVQKSASDVNRLKPLQWEKSICDKTKDLYLRGATAFSNLQNALVFKFYESGKNQSQKRAKVSIRL